MEQRLESGEEVYTYTLRYEYADEEYTVTDYSISSAEKSGYTYKKLFFEIDPAHKLEDISIMELKICCVAEPENVRHLLYIFKSGFGLLEYDFDTPGAGIPKDKTSPYAIPLCFVLMAAAGIIYSLIKTKYVLLIAPSALISLISSLFAREFYTTLIVLAVAYTAMLLIPIIKRKIKQKQN
jgi:hypothetical protein